MSFRFLYVQLHILKFTHSLYLYNINLSVYIKIQFNLFLTIYFHFLLLTELHYSILKLEFVSYSVQYCYPNCWFFLSYLYSVLSSFVVIMLQNILLAKVIISTSTYPALKCCHFTRHHNKPNSTPMFTTSWSAGPHSDSIFWKSTAINPN